MKNHTTSDKYFKYLTMWLSLLTLVLFAGICMALLLKSYPSIRQFGWHFLVGHEWDPVNQQFSGFAAIVGTIISSVIALIIAVPLSFLIAIFIAEAAPIWLKSPLAVTVELMAGIPSIIYGMWGLFILSPIMANYIQPLMIKLFHPIPLLNQLFQQPALGFGVFTAGLTLAIMIIPLISSVTRDLLNAEPNNIREAAYALGATRWEVVKVVLFPHIKIGLLGAVILGLGRALGETMAVTFVIGNSHQLSKSLFMPGTTIASTIANEFTEATGKLYTGALMELALILFVITLVTLVVARVLLSRSKS